jgi:4-oxalocrotonate tautomerase
MDLVVPGGTVARSDRLGRGNTMPNVTIQQGPRDVELKQELIQKITDAFVDTYKIPASSVWVWFQESPPESWGAGGVLKVHS